MHTDIIHGVCEVAQLYCYIVTVNKIIACCMSDHRTLSKKLVHLNVNGSTVIMHSKNLGP